MIRLNKYLADCGVGARRKCDQFIVEGKVSVNGLIEQRLGTKIDENVDQVRLHNKLLKPGRRFDYVLLNKPKGVVTTASDEKGRKTVLDIVKLKTRIFPVGRLDIDTTGLLLLTSDGELAYKLTHPKYKVNKIYEVQLETAFKAADKKKLESGIRLDEGITSGCQIEWPNPRNKKFVRITIYQGWNRQVRRMFAALGYKVLTLKRVGLACLSLGGLKKGEWRNLTTNEVNLLKTRTL